MAASNLCEEEVRLCATLPQELVDSILIINIISSSRDFCRLRCVSRRIKKLTYEKYDVVDLSDHPVCVAAPCFLEYASMKKHLPTTYIFWLLKMLGGRSDSWIELGIAFRNREEIDYCRYVVWSCISYFTVLVNFPNFSIMGSSSYCANPPETVYPMYLEITGHDEVEYHPHNRRTCCHKCFWLNELQLYVFNRN
ncbi:hypothetical protein ACFE04_012924 [Oxalis oulophora]